MTVRPLAHKLIVLTLLASMALFSTSCGTLLYPERRGQPRGGPLDPGVVILDALGLLFFVIPGVVAFVIDFGNGTIYLPPPVYPTVSHKTVRRSELVPVKLGREGMTREKIEQVVSERVGQPVTLEPGRFHAGELDTLDEFDDRVERTLDSSTESRPTAIRFQ
jgi:hypothetical protein